MIACITISGLAIIKLFLKKDYLFEMLKILKEITKYRKIIKIGLPMLQV